MCNFNPTAHTQNLGHPHSRLQKLGVTPSELLRQTLQYVADSGQIPFSSKLLTPEEDELLKTARARLKKPQRVQVSLDDILTGVRPPGTQRMGVNPINPDSA